jgi:uncharacterized protein YlzI (FlbEa/FlbD family)
MEECLFPMQLNEARVEQPSSNPEAAGDISVGSPWTPVDDDKQPSFVIPVSDDGNDKLIRTLVLKVSDNVDVVITVLNSAGIPVSVQIDAVISHVHAHGRMIECSTIKQR